MPPVALAGWSQNPIDRFVLARLEREGLRPSPPAPRETLIRRLSLDLIGLPPTLAEVDAFLADAGAGTVHAVVDRLMASPHFGERWARPWLDLARYADTHGYEKDNPRSIWKYRDWVIAALNDDMSFRQFTIAQIAGDLLPDATIDQQIATGFHRNTLLNQEGGVDDEDARWQTLVDRVNTTATVWLGTTLGCAQCHNHKFDPFTHEDYYRLLAFFDNAEYRIAEFGQGESWVEEPEIEIPTADQAAGAAAIRGELADLRARRPARRDSLDVIRALNETHRAVMGDPEIDTRIASYEMAYRMQTSVPELMNISSEPDSIHALYGTEPGRASFANNCLLARRLVERGVRFVQLYHWGWDHHGTSSADDIATALPRLCEDTARASAALIRDLKQRGLLDETLVIWGGEFGRTAMNEGRNRSKFIGRDHHPRAFTIWMAGGGVKPGISVGRTDDFGYNIVEDPIDVHDLHATALHLLGVDHTRLTYRFQGRDFRLTDVAGNVVAKLLA